MKKRTSNIGFTLVEVIIYVGVLSIIVVALFNFSQVTQTSQIQFIARSVQNQSASRILETIGFLVRNADGYVEDVNGNECFDTSRLSLYFATTSVDYLPPGCLDGFASGAVTVESVAFTGATPEGIDGYTWYGGTVIGDRIYVGGFNWITSARFIDNLALDKSYGADRYLGGGYNQYYSTNGAEIYDIETDGDYLYMAGISCAASDGCWGVSKNDLKGFRCSGPGYCDDVAFDTDGWVNTPGDSRTYALALDDTYIYAVGADYNSFTSELCGGCTLTTESWRIEKRAKADGALDTGFATDGILNMNDALIFTDSYSDIAYEIAIDDTYAYVVGISYSGQRWMISKFALSDGTIDTGFGTNGQLLTDDAGTSYARDIAIDDTYMYVSGYNDDLSGRIEKRLLSDGTYDTNFGDGGYINLSSNYALGIVIDDTYMYVASQHTGGDGYNFRVEKRLLTTGDLAGGFGDAGYADSEDTSDLPYGITMDDDYLYAYGDDQTAFNGERIEKRRKDNGQYEPHYSVVLQCYGNYPNYGLRDDCDQAPSSTQAFMIPMNDPKLLYMDSGALQFATTTLGSRDAIESTLTVGYRGYDLNFSLATLTVSSTEAFRIDP